MRLGVAAAWAATVPRIVSAFAAPQTLVTAPHRLQAANLHSRVRSQAFG